MDQRKIGGLLGIILIILSAVFILKPFFPPKLPKLTSPPSSPTHFSPPTLTSLMAVGDIMLGRMANVQMQKYKDFKYPFLKTASLLNSADITFGNLESPITKNCRATAVGMVFCAPPEAIAGLKFAGFDVLSIANNHILNQGQEGREQTKNLLLQNNILTSDSNNVTMKQCNNLTIGLLSFDLTQMLTITHDRDQKSTMELIKSGAKNVDILIVSLHWGNEYQKSPTQQQKDLAHQMIDAGAKVIIGHHPHVVQPMEKYHDGLIFYSLGNFVFDQPWSEETKKGNIAKITFEGKDIKSYELVPIYIEDYCQPHIPSASF